MSDGSERWPAPGCARCGHGVEGTRTVVEEHRETVVRVRVLCPDCYRGFLGTPAVGDGIRVFKAGDERRVSLDRTHEDRPAPTLQSVGPPVPVESGEWSPDRSRSSLFGTGWETEDGADDGQGRTDGRGPTD